MLDAECRMLNAGYYQIIHVSTKSVIAASAELIRIEGFIMRVSANSQDSTRKRADSIDYAMSPDGPESQKEERNLRS